MEAQYKFLTHERPCDDEYAPFVIEGGVSMVVNALAAPSAAAASPMAAQHILVLLVTCIKCLQRQQTRCQLWEP